MDENHDHEQLMNDPTATNQMQRLIRSTTTKVERQWSNSVIPFKMSNDFSEIEKNFIKDTMMEIANSSCVRFQQRKKEKNYLKIMRSKKNSCKSFSSRKRSRKLYLKLTKDCLNRNGLLHELMHVLGISSHEHNRYDRDEFIEILSNNLNRKYLRKFRKSAAFHTTHVNATYDYKSVTHYPTNAFSKNGQPTIRVKIPNVEIKADGLSDADKLKINRLYDCERTES